MKALTIHQPYAELVASGQKRCENRTWQTHYRGPLAIHASAGKSMLRDAARYGLDLRALEMRGAFLAVAQLVDCVPVDRIRSGLFPDVEPAILEHAFGPWCWILEDVRRLDEPIVCPGRQGLWTPPADFLLQLAAGKM